MIGRIRRADGISVVEVTIVMMIMSVVLVALVGTLVRVQSSEVINDRDARAIGSLRIAVQRLSRELRQARTIYPDSTGSRLHFWVDEDRDNQQDLDERLIWNVLVDGESATLTRSTEADPTELPMVDLIVPGSPFTYLPDEPSVTLVTLVSIELVADTSTEVAPESRTVRTEVRLRNAPR